MRFFTLHERPGNGGDVIAVASGFSWAAALVPVLWLLWHRLWLALAGYVAFSILLGLGTDFGGIADPATALIAVAVSFLLGCMAADIRRWTLARRGWRLAGVVLAGSAAEAEERWLRAPGNHPAAAAAPAPGIGRSVPRSGDGAFPKLV
jgi:hypothetical protein